jgi:hypothetical protein
MVRRTVPTPADATIRTDETERAVGFAALRGNEPAFSGRSELPSITVGSLRSSAPRDGSHPATAFQKTLSRVSSNQLRSGARNSMASFSRPGVLNVNSSGCNPETTRRTEHDRRAVEPRVVQPLCG